MCRVLRTSILLEVVPPEERIKLNDVAGGLVGDLGAVFKDCDLVVSHVSFGDALDRGIRVGAGQRDIASFARQL